MCPSYQCAYHKGWELIFLNVYFICVYICIYFLMNGNGCGFLDVYVCLSPWHNCACLCSFFSLTNNFTSLYFCHDEWEETLVQLEFRIGSLTLNSKFYFLELQTYSKQSGEQLSIFERTVFQLCHLWRPSPC